MWLESKRPPSNSSQIPRREPRGLSSQPRSNQPTTAIAAVTRNEWNALRESRAAASSCELPRLRPGATEAVRSRRRAFRNTRVDPYASRAGHDRRGHRRSWSAFQSGENRSRFSKAASVGTRKLGGFFRQGRAIELAGRLLAAVDQPAICCCAHVADDPLSIRAAAAVISISRAAAPACAQTVSSCPADSHCRLSKSFEIGTRHRLHQRMRANRRHSRRPGSGRQRGAHALAHFGFAEVKVTVAVGIDANPSVRLNCPAPVFPRRRAASHRRRSRAPPSAAVLRKVRREVIMASFASEDLAAARRIALRIRG